MKKVLFLLIALLFFGGCINPSTPEDVIRGIDIKEDSFTKTKTFSTPKYSNTNGMFSSCSARIVYMEDKETSSKKFSIRTSVYYTQFGVELYNTARDKKGNKLNFTYLSSDTGGCSQMGCSQSEEGFISLSEKFLKEQSEAGITFRTYSNRYHMECVVPGFMISSFLKYIGDINNPTVLSSKQ